MIQTGLTCKKKITVTPEMTAAAMGSGALEVLATPSMIALMEGTAQEAVQNLLEDGQGTVGTRIDVRHLAATPVGMEVTCTAEVTEVDRRRIVFTVKAKDEKEVIGEGIHERFVIDNEKFFAKCRQKLEK
ncbi:MAG: thioesterase family protein [Clostridia bacterium]|uniref:Thioesterase n=1 Tax=Mogibacterium kristiansenii TaxID=2606708 RepID=A0A6N7X390_9FIRM|nr:MULTISPECIES: thioesterase family protein [Mogibacterium]MDY5450088.1 thioesterase family protein [Clostridia bacterium]MCI7123837.1 thioesterase family protein [Mogibacterium sp.]MDD6700676.1 thioesterase family protein [Mogibacterium kristiansenii]MEE0369081.1 thioesterase family protein [Clostridia bacterium]MST70107.1 thioesterase [Mogibacterium kristiansenii]